jgi:peptidoglycan hydrolase-like protein with peptidoglycan-binding domain
VSSRIDTLEPNGEPLAVLLASIVARISSQDFIQSYGSPSDQHEGDIARRAERAIAGVPLGLARGRYRAELTETLRLFVATRIGVGVQLVNKARRELAAAVPAFRDIGATALHRLRQSRTSTLPARLSAIAGHSGTKVGAGLALVALGLALVLVFVSGRFGRLAPPANESAPTQPPSAAFAEERPPGGTRIEFTRGNLRYCTFQQIRLEALGPITEGADLVVFNALVDDWNARCTNYGYRSEDKGAVDAEAARRRALLEVEGRALLNVWRRKVVTTVQQLPASGPDAGEPVAATIAPEQTSDAAERLPLLITLGRTTAEESDREGGFWLRTPSLTLLRPEVAMRVQRRLNDLGYTVAPLDGTWGPGSRAALRRFKKANGLLGNDAFDAETVTRLFSTSAVTAVAAGERADQTTAIETVYPPPPAADMNPLNRADGQRIQQRLADLGYYSGRGNGGWDNALRAALRRFKAANGLGNNEEWDAPVEAVLFDEQAARADAGANDQRKSVTPPATMAVPLPPRRPAPPAKSTPARVGAATRASP